jgi:hypothetical protein
MNPTLAAALVGAVPATIAACLGIWNSRKIKTVQITVNHRLDMALERVEQLTHALEGSNTAVPDRPHE